MLTEEQLLEIEARCKAATPGPWEWSGGRYDDVRLVGLGQTVLQPDLYHCEAYIDVSDADKLFIAAARSDVPALVAEVRRLSDALSELEVRYAMEKMNRFALRVANKENE